MSLRILALPRYGALGASSRLRTLQYLPALRADGIQVDVHPLLGDDYVAGLYRGKVSRLRVLGAYILRVKQLLWSGRYDVVWVEKELFPWLPAPLELLLIRRKARLLVDYDDALFHRYDQHRSGLVRRLLGHKIDAIMRRADVVVVGNPYLAERARMAGARRVESLPTVVDLARYPVCPSLAPADEIVIGWIGSPSTAGYLRAIAPVLRELSERHRIRCVAIGARPDQVEGMPFEAMAWSEATEVASLRTFDIGVMPLADAPFERGKCGYKLIQYMACGLPVVASPVGVNQQLVRHGENGYLASTHLEWVRALEWLVDDAVLRREMGRDGRAAVEHAYCLQVQAPHLADVLRSIGKGAA